jgi:DNA invertase Pin-like site-specific DNA recombinase
MPKYFIYCRKSSEAEDRQMLSIESQRNEMNALVSRLHIEISEIFIETRSAKEPGRPIFNEMMGRIYKGEAKGVVCWKLDRLARNPIDGAAVIWALKQSNIEIITPNQTYRHGDDNTILMYIEFGMAQKYIDDLSRNVKRGNKTKLEKGLWIGKSPIGYLNYTDPFTHEKTVIVDKERFPIVRKMWDLALKQAYSVRQIVAIANYEWGLKTVKTRRQGGATLCDSAGYRIFTNPFYCGLMRRSEGEFPHQYKKMVTESEFDRVQVILGHKGKPRKKTHEFAFTGMIKCAECGCSVTAENKIKINKGNKHVHSYTYYHCTKKKREIKCSQPCVEIKTLEEQIDSQLQKIQISKRVKVWAINYLNSNKNKEIVEKNLILANLKKSLYEYENQLTVLTKMRCKNMIEDEEFLKEKSNLKNEMTKIEKNLNSMGYDAGSLSQMMANIFKFACHAREWFQKGDLNIRRRILMSLGSNLVLKDKILWIEAVKPFIMIEKMLNAIASKNDRLEPANKLDFTWQNALFEPQFFSLLGLVEDVRTYLLESGTNLSIYIPEKEGVLYSGSPLHEKKGVNV